MAFRRRMKKSKSKRLFRKTAQKTHRKNFPPRVMRGGFRI